MFGLAEWGARHAFGEPRPEELDPELLMWWLQGTIEPEGLDRRAVLQIDVRDQRRLFWLVLEPGEVSVCYTDPGFEVDAVLRSSLSDLYRLWEGHVDLLDAVRHGSMDLTGARWLIRSLPQWLQASPVVPYVRTARTKAEPSSA